MAIQTSNPVAVIEPEVPFDKLAIQLVIAPNWQPTRVGAAVVINAVPYRQLSDGTIEKLDSAARSINIGDAFVEAQTDPALAEAVTAIYAALEKFVAAKGL